MPSHLTLTLLHIPLKQAPCPNTIIPYIPVLKFCIYQYCISPYTSPKILLIQVIPFSLDQYYHPLYTSTSILQYTSAIFFPYTNSKILLIPVLPFSLDQYYNNILHIPVPYFLHIPVLKSFLYQYYNYP